MKMHINTNQLKESLKVLGKGSKKRGERFLIADDNQITLVDRNIDKSLILTNMSIVLGSVATEDIQLQILNDIKDVERAVNCFESDDTELIYNNNELKFKNGDKTFILDVSFANIGKVNSPVGNKYIFTADLKQRLDSLIPMTSKDDYRPALGGIIFHDRDMVALDGYMLGKHQAKASSKNQINKGDDFVLNKYASKLLLDVLKTTKNKKDIIINKNKSNIEFVIDNITITTKEIAEGSIIDYKDILKQTANKIGRIETSLEQLEKSIKFIETTAPFVRLIDNKMIGFDRNKNQNNGYKYQKVGLVELENSNMDDEASIALDSTKFKNVVLALKKGLNKKDNINIEFYGQYKGLYFRAKGFEYMLLPLRLENMVNIK